MPRSAVAASSPSTPLLSPARRSTRASSSKPRQTPLSPSSTPSAAHHSQTADELAAEEAAKILRLNASPSQALRSMRPSLESPRDLRHRHLMEARQVTTSPSAPRDRKSSTALGGDDEEDGEIAQASAFLDGMIADEEDEEDASPPPTAGRLEPFVEITRTASRRPVTVPSQEPPITEMKRPASNAEDSESDEESDASSSSDDDSDSDSSSASETTSESEADSDEEHLEALLQKAKLSAQAKQAFKGAAIGQSDAEGNGEILLSFNDEESSNERPIPDISVGQLPPQYLSFQTDGSAKAAKEQVQVPAGPSRPRKQQPTQTSRQSQQQPQPEPDNRPYEPELSRKQKAAQPRKATASELWSTLPAPRSELLPQMRKDYQALALANSLDPKRFMKGSTKLSKVPQTFAIGTMMDAPRRLQDSTLARERKYKAGDIVRSLVDDQTTGAYAKRKYGDLQSTRMEKGRGKGWKKRSKW